MAKIILGNRPKTFKRVISVDLLEGGKGAIDVTFKYRTKVEFGEFLDKLLEDGGLQPAKRNDDEKLSLLAAQQKTTETNADYIMNIVEGWNLDADFNRDNVKQLCDELPAAALAIMETYRLAINEGRLGN
jgi:hypothetical protein